MTHPNDIDFTQSRWLRDAKTALLQRDPVDSLNDAEALVRFAQKRLDALMQQKPT